MVNEVRIIGAMGAVELLTAPHDIEALRLEFLKYDTWIRPINNVIYLMPAFTIETEELSRPNECNYSRLFMSYRPI